MTDLRFYALSLRYSSWSIRPWLALTAARATFTTETVELDDLHIQGSDDGPALAAVSADQLERRRMSGSVTGLYPVLYVDGSPVHESLAICEWVADTYPDARLWPEGLLDRAGARSVCCEMVAGFQNLRARMSCHVFARVPNHVPDAAIDADIRRIFEIWSRALDRSGGPFLFGSFGIPDCMYFPVLSRFRTYGVKLDAGLETYAQKVEAHPAVDAWRQAASSAPSVPVYDDYIRRIGGDPEAGRPR